MNIFQLSDLYLIFQMLIMSDIHTIVDGYLSNFLYIVVINQFKPLEYRLDIILAAECVLVYSGIKIVSLHYVLMHQTREMTTYFRLQLNIFFEVDVKRSDYFSCFYILSK